LPPCSERDVTRLTSNSGPSNSGPSNSGLQKVFTSDAIRSRSELSFRRNELMRRLESTGSFGRTRSSTPGWRLQPCAPRGWEQCQPCDSFRQTSPSSIQGYVVSSVNRGALVTGLSRTLCARHFFSRPPCPPPLLPAVYRFQRQDCGTPPTRRPHAEG